MHLHTYLSAVGHNSHIAGNNSRDVGFLGCINNLMHKFHILIIDDSVHCEVALHAMLGTCSSYLTQVVNSKMIGRMRAHI